MSDEPTPQPAPQPAPVAEPAAAVGPPLVPAPARSVIIETNSQVSVPRWPLWGALAAVVALAAFTAIWFVTREDGTYRPGPVVVALQESAAENGLELVFSSDEARCIDESAVAHGMTEDMIGGDTLLPSEFSTPETDAFSVAMMDGCLTREHRVEILVDSLMEDAPEAIDEEAVQCLGGAMDDAIIESGGYAQLADSGDSSSGLGMALFGALDECDIDFEDLMS